MNVRRRFTSLLAGVLCAIAWLPVLPDAFAQDRHAHATPAAASMAARDLGTAAAFDKAGRLWIVKKDTDDAGQYVVLQSSMDMGATWTPPVRIQKTHEPVAASGQARPHIAFGNRGEMYITYTSTVARPHIGNIRLVRSLDGGKTFSEPITVHANRDHIVHSFESIVVDGRGRIFVAWIDGRDAALARQRNQGYAGSALYYAVSTDRGETFNGDIRIADHTCECCRIGLALNANDVPVAMWRHIFADNIRDHALAELGPKGAASEVTRVSFDDWRIDACPHHGPSLAYGSDGKRHQVWFNGKEAEGSGVLYAATQAGKPGTPIALGSGQSSHADVIVRDNQVAIVWKEFDGKSTAIVARLSEDGGSTWTQTEAGRTSASSDNPYLIKSPEGIVLIWRTLDEGVRVIPLHGMKS